MRLLRRAYIPLSLTLLLHGAPALGQGEDARVLPRGLVGLRVEGEFVSFDSRLGGGEAGGPLGAPLATSFPAALFPRLDTVRTELSRFFERTGEAFAVGAEDVAPGTLDVGVAADLRRIPLSLEAGVTGRLTLRATVPVERRGTAVTGLRLVGGAIGTNPTAVRDTLSRLFGRIDPGLASVGRLPFLPLAGSRAGQELQERYARATGDTTTLPLPRQPISAAALDSLLVGAGRDPLPFTGDRGDYLLGDIELGAKLQLLNTVDAAVPGGAGARLAVEVVGRLPTAQGVGLDSLTGVVSESGHAGAAAAAYGDYVGARLWVTAFARYGLLLPRDVERFTLEAGTPVRLGPVQTVRRDPGDRLEAAVTPRFRLTGELSVGGQYAFVRQGETVYGGDDVLADPNPAFQGFAGLESTAARSAHLLGFGAGYSTLDAYRAGRTPVPLELSVLYRTAVAGSGGAEDAGVVQVTGRILYPLWGRR